MLLAVLIGPGIAGGVVGFIITLSQTSFGSGPDLGQNGLAMDVLGGSLGGAFFGCAFGLIPTAFAMLLAFLVLPLQAVTPLRFGVVFVIAGAAAGAAAAIWIGSPVSGLLSEAAWAAIPASVPAVIAIWYLARRLRLIEPTSTSEVQ